ncbi:unnamed protein product [Brachionus calyciflorus]|uniref:Uncharacterized protein n=1 Tax=Brachionus calyciflorus TaxID=104777 RepID=A0A813X369_9BILA|nr:unnamed protein product [Brachionus calyciflorus]
MIKKIVNTLEVNIVHTSDENDDEYDDDDDVELSQSQRKSMKRHTDYSILNDLIEVHFKTLAKTIARIHQKMELVLELNSDEVTRSTIDRNPILIEERLELGDREISPNSNDIPQTSREILDNDLSSSTSQNQESSEIKATAESIVDHKVKIFLHENGNKLIKRVTFQELKVVKPSYYEKLKMRFSAINLKWIVFVSSLLLIFFILITEMKNEYSLSKKAYEECILSKASWYSKFNFLSSKCINKATVLDALFWINFEDDALFCCNDRHLN